MAIYSYIGMFPYLRKLLRASKTAEIHQYSIILGRATIHVFGQRTSYGANFVQHFHWNQQLLFWLDCPASADG
jgi:hypothetical protein